jgi:hypothetical protein
MKAQRAVSFLSIATLSLCAWTYPSGWVAERAPAAKTSESVRAFLGRWDLTLKTPEREYPSWLELREAAGQLQAQMVGRWGNARPLPKASLSNGHLTFVSPKDEEASKVDWVFEGTLAGDRLSGTINGPEGPAWTWTGRRAPTLDRTGTLNWERSVSLFNGKDLTGWSMSPSDSPKLWKVEDGTLVTPGNGPELISNSKFEDFKLHVEFSCAENSNSGIYLRGRYEVQVETDSIEEPPSHHMGGVYGFLAPKPELPRKPGTWQAYDITLIGRRITVVQNGQTIIDNKEIPGITGGALDSHEELPGPIYLQGSEKGRVAYRTIIITPAAK